jgi:two-component system, cell cycle sensor histidine kinase and response regulator CckA
MAKPKLKPASTHLSDSSKKKTGGPKIVAIPPRKSAVRAEALGHSPSPSTAQPSKARSHWSAIQPEDIEKVAPSEAALRNSEIMYRRLFETAQDGILILNADTGLITNVNPFMVKLLGFSREEFLGKALWDIGLFSDIEASKEAFLELQAQQYIRYEDLPLKTKDGRAINVEFVSNVYLERGNRVIQCNVRDITKRKHAEQSEQQLLQSQKLEAVGQLAAGVAHDFNNLLGVILGYCEVLETCSDLGEPIRRMIGEIHNAGTSAKVLTQHLLAFSRRQVLQPVFLDLNAVVRRVDRMLSRLIGDDVRLVSVLHSKLGTIKADPSQIEQVLINLVVNSRDAMPTGGKITVETASVEIDQNTVRRHLTPKPGSYVLLTVTDTGVGMDKLTQSRIFEPYFSTKAAGKGTGLGLSTVFGIVDQSGGSIGVESAPGHGTTFNVYFPRCQEAPAGIEQEQEGPLRGGPETILLVEDAGPLREMTRRLLEDCGYTVLDSGDPAEAILLAGRHEGPLPLLITDVVMPGLSGSLLAEKLVAARPGMKVLYTSGYAVDELGQHGAPRSEQAFLEKPFTRDTLVRKVRELLDSTTHTTV